MIYGIRHRRPMYKTPQSRSQRGDLVCKGMFTVIAFDDEWEQWANHIACHGHIEHITHDKKEAAEWIEKNTYDTEDYQEAAWVSFPDGVIELPKLTVPQTNPPRPRKTTVRASEELMNSREARLVDWGFSPDVIDWLDAHPKERSRHFRFLYDIMIEQAENAQDYQSLIDREDVINDLLIRLLDESDNAGKHGFSNRCTFAYNLHFLLRQDEDTISFLAECLSEGFSLNDLLREADWWEIAMDAHDAGVSLQDIYA